MKRSKRHYSFFSGYHNFIKNKPKYILSEPQFVRSEQEYIWKGGLLCKLYQYKRIIPDRLCWVIRPDGYV